MADTFRFELVTPERMALSEDVAEVVVPGVEGEFTVLPGHAPTISALRPGVIEVALADASKTRIFVKGGFAEVDAGHLTVRFRWRRWMLSSLLPSWRRPRPSSPPPATTPPASPPPSPWIGSGRWRARPKTSSSVCPVVGWRYQVARSTDANPRYPT
jgi:hypothetical protein